MLHKFENDFYDSYLRIIICGYIRPQFAFESLQKLMEWIDNDIQFGSKTLDIKPYSPYKYDEFFFDIDIPTKIVTNNKKSTNITDKKPTSLNTNNNDDEMKEDSNNDDSNDPKSKM